MERSRSDLAGALVGPGREDAAFFDISSGKEAVPSVPMRCSSPGCSQAEGGHALSRSPRPGEDLGGRCRAPGRHYTKLHHATANYT